MKFVPDFAGIVYTKAMKIRKRFLISITYLTLVLCAAWLSGCGNGAKQEVPSVTDLSSDAALESGASSAEDQDIYLITRIDSTAESIQMYRYRNGKEYRFSYTVDTLFRDKYQKSSSVSAFYPGKAVLIGSVDDEGRLSEVTMADAVWQYDDIVRFSVDEEKGILRIADSNYRITSETRVFSDGDQVDFSDISENDVLSVVGQEKDILSVCITTGHGDLQLLNTDLFEGSFLQLNTNIFAKITPEMTLELPEGSYLLAVANNGWGGSCEIQVVRGETVQVDLDTIKGEGPKYGTVRFVFDMEEVYLTIDGKSVDYSDLVTLQYGRHSLKAACSGYTEISKYLFVNCEEATISISFAEEEAASEAAEAAAAAEQDSEDESDKDTESDDDNTSKEDVLKDYLSTLTELIDSL
jgi:hypothetical protein